MNIEIMDFYPLKQNEERQTLSGTLRINLPDLGIHLLGVFVARRRDSWYFRLPSQRAIHHETGEEVSFPYIVFEDREMQKLLIQTIREKGQDFIEKRLADKANPLVIPKPVPKAVVPQKTLTTRQFNLKSQYVDPPKRKSFSRAANGR